MSAEAGRFGGRVAFVTGSGRNLGRALATRLAAEGADVVVHVRDNEAEGREVVGEVEALGRRALLVVGEVSDPDAVSAMFAQADEAFGRLDVLVNNVGIRPHGTVLEMDVATWRRVIDVSLNGAFYCAKAAAEAMVRHGHGGSIVNITGSAAAQAKTGRAHVVAAKSGLQGLTRALAAELGPYGIRANSVAPVGLSDTSRPAAWYPELAKDGPKDFSSIPLRRAGTTQDIAEAVLFLASDAAAFVTGQALHVNGGAYMI